MQLKIALAATLVKSADAQDYAAQVTGLPNNSFAVIHNDDHFIKLRHTLRAPGAGQAVIEHLNQTLGRPTIPVGLEGYLQWNLTPSRMILIHTNPNTLIVILKDMAHAPKSGPSTIQREKPTRINRYQQGSARR